MANKMGLLQEFHEYRMGPNDSIEQHLAKVQNKAANLTDLGETISDNIVISKLLSSLSPKYSTLRTTWDSIEPNRQTIANLQTRLIREEANLKSGSDEGASALAVSKQIHQKKSGDEKFKKKRSKKKIECLKCHEMEHYARGCKSGKLKKNEPEEKDACDCAFVGERKKNIKESAVVKLAGLSCGPVGKIQSAQQKEIWLSDNGASAYMTFRREWLTEYHEDPRGGTVLLGDNEKCNVVGVGKVNIRKLINGVWEKSCIENVLHVPKLKKNLFSVGACVEKGYKVIFENKLVKLKRNGEVVASGIQQDNRIYRMLFKVKAPKKTEEANVTATNLRMWHERLGHIGKRAIRELVKKGLVKGVSMSDSDDFFFEACQLGKAHRQPFKRCVEKVKTEPEKIHTDVCVPMSADSLSGARFFLTFRDDATGFRHVYFVKHKSDVFDKFKEFAQLVKNKFNKSIKILRSDNGREFCNAKMDEYLTARGIKKENTAPHTPEQNGKAERDNRTIVESA